MSNYNTYGGFAWLLRIKCFTILVSVITQLIDSDGFGGKFVFLGMHIRDVVL